MYRNGVFKKEGHYMAELVHDMVHTLQVLGNSLEKASELIPDFMKAQMGIFELSESTGNVKRKELIAIALAVYGHCTYCIAYHVKNAVEAGATKADIMEAASVAVELGGGIAITYLSYVMDACDQLGAK